MTLRHLEANNTLIVGFEYGYDRMNDRTFQRKLHDPNNSELYSYDSSYRLLDFQRGTLNAQGNGITTPSTDASQKQEWNLDGVGNWDKTIITDENGVNTTDNRDHSSFNELIAQNGITLRYDDNGNLVEDAECLYQWDSRNRLRVPTRKGDGVVAEYSYDAMGRRIIKDVSNSGALDGVTYFYHDGMQEIEERDGSNVLKQQYVYGNYIDEVLVMDQNSDGDNSAIGVGDKGFYYHQDALFSVYAVTDETGQVAESYLYDPYGKVTVFNASGNPVPENAWGTAHSAIDNPYLFTGRRLDGMNLYEYVMSNPITHTDPIGLLTPGFLKVAITEENIVKIFFLEFNSQASYSLTIALTVKDSTSGKIKSCDLTLKCSATRILTSGVKIESHVLDAVINNNALSAQQRLDLMCYGGL